MKYIRTKEHIYEYVEQRIHTSQYTKFGLYRHNLNSDYEQIIAEAETIEELCDEFVFVDFGIFNDKEYHFKTLEESKKCNALYDRCYGAIYTDKGLIYIAKMNDKGGFDLI